MKKFSTFDNTENHILSEYIIKTPYMIPSDLFPWVLTNYKDTIGIKRLICKDLIWHQDNFDNETVWYPPVGICNDYKKAFKKYVPSGALFVAIPDEFRLILLDALGDSITFERTPYLDDYIICNESLSNLIGNKYKSIRQSVKRFSAKYNPEVLDLSQVNMIDIFELNRTSLNQLKGLTNDISSIIREGMISGSLIENYYAHPSDFIGTAIMINHKPVAFSISEIIKPRSSNSNISKPMINISNTSVGIYLKCNREYAGSGTYLSVMDAKRQYSLGFKYCNIMADEGSMALKASKLLLRPCTIIPKYSALYKR